MSSKFHQERYICRFIRSKHEANDFADFYRNNDNNEVGKERINKLERLIRQRERKMKINGISFARLSFPMTTGRIMPSNLSRITI